MNDNTEGTAWRRSSCKSGLENSSGKYFTFNKIHLEVNHTECQWINVSHQFWGAVAKILLVAEFNHFYISLKCLHTQYFVSEFESLNFRSLKQFWGHTHPPAVRVDKYPGHLARLLVLHWLCLLETHHATHHPFKQRRSSLHHNIRV